MLTVAVRPLKSQHKPISNSEEHELMMYNYEHFYSNKDELVRFSFLGLRQPKISKFVLHFTSSRLTVFCIVLNLS